MSPLQNAVLIVEDEFIIAELLTILVQNMDIKVCGTAARAEEAIRLAELHRPAVVLMDMRLQGALDGVDAALAIHASLGSKVIFITGSREPQTIARIQLDHPAAVLFKPISDRQLQTAVRAALPL